MALKRALRLPKPLGHHSADRSDGKESEETPLPLLLLLLSLLLLSALLLAVAAAVVVVVAIRCLSKKVYMASLFLLHQPWW